MKKKFGNEELTREEFLDRWNWVFDQLGRLPVATEDMLKIVRIKADLQEMARFSWDDTHPATRIIDSDKLIE